MTEKPTVAILGGGNIGLAIATGLTRHGKLDPKSITVTRRNTAAIDGMREEGYHVTTSNREALDSSTTVLLCVQPSQAIDVLASLKDAFDHDRHRIISVVTGVSCDALSTAAGGAGVVRAMPNTAVAVGESMTCIASRQHDPAAVQAATALFSRVGTTLVIPEELMTQATALCACGIAFFLRAVRAASQGGIEIGFHAEEALAMAAQTARGAASLLLTDGRHPEGEIDRVTTPMGCTISGLNQMEHEGFSSAMIKGIVTSARKAGKLGGASDN